MQEIKKIEKVTPELLEDGIDFLSRTDHILDMFNQRIEYIIKTIAIECNETMSVGWELFSSIDKNDSATITNIFNADIIYVSVYGDYNFEIEKSSIIDKNGNEYLLRSHYSLFVPSRWLYEDFEEELALGKKAYAKLAAEQDKANIKEQGKQNDLISSAKAKLLPEELEALSKEIFKEKAV